MSVTLPRWYPHATKFAEFNEKLKELHQKSNDIAKYLQRFHIPFPIDKFKKFGIVTNLEQSSLAGIENMSWRQGIMVDRTGEDGFGAVVILIPWGHPLLPDHPPVIYTIMQAPIPWAKDIASTFISTEIAWQAQFTPKK